MRFDMEQGTGECRVGADGLYWVIDAVCARSGPDAPRLYCDGRSLGPFCPENGKWRLQTRVSNRALPITPQSVFTLSPPDLVPYDPSQPSAYLLVSTLPIAAMTAGEAMFSDAISSMLRCCRWYSDCICDAISGSNCAR